MAPTTTDSAIAAENKESVKILEQMLTNLSIATSADTVNKASLSLASFINGPIEDKDAPTQYVPLFISGLRFPVTNFLQSFRQTQGAAFE